MIVPKNEQGVVVLFQELSRDLGFQLVHVQSPFPDAIVEDRHGKEYRVEFEFKSSNFISHKHNPEECDLVICWIHDSEIGVPVISLSQYIRNQNVKLEKTKITKIGCFWTILNFGISIGLLMVFINSFNNNDFVFTITAIIWSLHLLSMTFQLMSVQDKLNHVSSRMEN